MKSLNVTNFHIVYSFAFVGIAIFLSNLFMLGLEKDIIISSILCVFNLLVIGYILVFIFSFKKLGILIMTLSMLTIAAATSTRHWKGKNKMDIFIINFISLSVSALIAILFIKLTNLVKFETQFVIPLVSMSIGNSMNMLSQMTKRLQVDFKNSLLKVERLISLGLSKFEITKYIVKETFKQIAIPRLDTMRTMGLVHLPGGMTGLILAGVSPLKAVKMQIIIMFLLLSSVFSILSISSIFLTKFLLKESEYRV